MRRKSAALLLCLLLTLLFSVSASASTEIVQPTDAYYVADYANVLSNETEQFVVEQVQALKQLCGGEIAVVTIDFLNDLNSEEYAYEIINQWGVGDAQKNNGAVLLLVPGEGKGWLTVGAGLEDYLTAGVLDEILNTYCWGYFDNGDYDAAVVNTVGALLEQYESYYGISLANATGTTAAPQSAAQAYGPSVGERIFHGIIYLILILAVVGVLFRPGRRHTFLFCGNPFGPFCGPRPPRGPHGPFGPGGLRGALEAASAAEQFGGAVWRRRWTRRRRRKTVISANEKFYIEVKGETTWIIKETIRVS